MMIRQLLKLCAPQTANVLDLELHAVDGNEIFNVAVVENRAYLCDRDGENGDEDEKLLGGDVSKERR